MKTIKNFYVVVTLFCAVMVAGLWSCSTNSVEWEGGNLPDKDPLENTYGFLNSMGATDRQVEMLMTQGGGFVTDKLYYQITKPAPSALSLELSADLSEETLLAFNLARQAKYKAEGIEEAAEPYILLPEANFELPDGKSFEIAPTDKKSAVKRIKVLGENLAAGLYLLPITVSDSGQKGEKQTLYYTITIRQPQLGDHELHKGEDFFFVFYINTKQYQPLLVDDYYMERKPRRGAPKPGDGSWYGTIGNIINLRTVTLNYESTTKRAKLNLGSDMNYVLNNVVKYIRPLQDKGRKVCLSIEGGGTGLGFCNLSDVQIADFTAQIKAVVETYELDGINLWDRDSGYDKSGMAAVNTTSYPKLIKALREALGKDRLLTVTAHGTPTETFYDIAASGEIAVGDYIDYAWSGYNSELEAPQLCDPWHPDYELVSAYTQKPIAGLDPSKFGCINSPLYGSGTNEYNDQSFMAQWVKDGYKPNNIVVFSDLRTNLQDSYEGLWDSNITSTCVSLAEKGSFSGLPASQMISYDFDKSQLDRLPNGGLGYNKWLKDW